MVNNLAKTSESRQMRQICLIFSLLASLFPFSVAAQVDCTVFDALERIQFAQGRLSTSKDDIFIANDAQLLAGEVKRLDSDQIALAHNGTLSALDRAFLQAYLANATRLSNMISRRQVAAITTYFADPAFTPRQEQISRLLPRLKCNATSSSGATTGNQRLLSSVKQDSALTRITFVNSVVTLASCVFLIALTHRLYVWGVAWRQGKSRRSKRFHAHIETQIEVAGILRRGVILDLSCNGAKIQSDTTETDAVGTHLNVWIINCWHPAKIIWLNTHYIGIRFDRRMRHAFVQAICHPVD